MSFSRRFTLNAEVFLSNPTPEQAERLAYAQRFLEGLQLVSRVATDEGYARELDYDIIKEDELMWIGSEMHKIPNPNSSSDIYCADPTGTHLRDQAAKAHFHKPLTTEQLIAIPSHRETESYF